MMDRTDRHCRFLHRLISGRALLYTEMVTAPALIHGDHERLLAFGEAEHPVALQIGSSEPEELAKAAALGVAAGYDEINLNVGCPSDRVQSGRFGACLMLEPDLVADGVAAMGEAADGVPITVKCRIGVDDQDPREALLSFVERVAEAGCCSFTVHARKAWLKGLSPKENREVPPLDYALVRALKRARPDLEIILNGGLATLDQAQREAEGLDGVMLGRAAFDDPWLMACVDERVFGEAPSAAAREDVMAAYANYAERVFARGRVSLSVLIRPALGLYHGALGARVWRRTLSEGVARKGVQPAALFDEALAAVASAAKAA